MLSSLFSYSRDLIGEDIIMLSYTDYEGLQGGESLPGAAKSIQPDEAGATQRQRAGQPSAIRKTFRKAKASSRRIQWANTLETRKPEYAVPKLYPRSLYTFSDVVVLVLRNTG